MLTLKELTIGNFMYDLYLPSLEKYIYHVHYVQILSMNLCGKLRHNVCYSEPGNISSIRDYIERISAKSNLKIKSENFGNGKSISIEGCMIDVADQVLNGNVEFHSLFLDDNHQDVSTAHVYMTNILTEIRNNNQLKKRCTIWESTNGYCK